MPHCYMGELGADDGRCDHEARYVAVLADSAQARWYLCEEHAQEERAWDNVVTIESFRPDSI